MPWSQIRNRCSAVDSQNHQRILHGCAWPKILPYLLIFRRCQHRPTSAALRVWQFICRCQYQSGQHVAVIIWYTGVEKIWFFGEKTRIVGCAQRSLGGSPRSGEAVRSGWSQKGGFAQRCRSPGKQTHTNNHVCALDLGASYIFCRHLLQYTPIGSKSRSGRSSWKVS